MADRYFVSAPLPDLGVQDASTFAVLEEAEAHHLAHVLRAKPGDQVVLFDGSGREALARVERVGRSRIELAIVRCQVVDRESPVELTLAVALPKGDRQKWLVEKIAELGAVKLVPLVAQRGVAQPEPAAIARLRRTAIEAAKQCGRNLLLDIVEAQSVTQVLDAAPPHSDRWLAHPAGESLRVAAARPARPMLAMIGPEGGFAEFEVDAARARGFTIVDLGPSILRVETAAILLASVAASRALV